MLPHFPSPLASLGGPELQRQVFEINSNKQLKNEMEEDGMTNRLALVTNANDFVGPPAVTALIESGFKVIVHDPAFLDSDEREKYQEGLQLYRG